MQIKNSIFVVILFLIFSSCSHNQISAETEIELFEDLFERIYQNCLKGINKGFEEILVYKYLTHTDTLSINDTVKINRREIPPVEFNMGDKQVSLMSDFLNKSRNKYKRLHPDIGVIISDINFISRDKLYFIVTIFSSSASVSVYRINYEIKDKKPEFINYELIVYG